MRNAANSAAACSLNRPADDCHLAGRRGVSSHRQPVQRGVFAEITPAGAGRIEVSHPLDRMRPGQVVLQDQTSGTYADSRRRLRADQREVVQRVAHARHPAGDRVITSLSVCGIAGTQVVETQHAKTEAGQALGEGAL